MNKTDKMGVDPINKLLLQQAIPSALGILMLSVNGIVDSIFLGNFVGSLAIGAVSVVLPISFLLSSFGMAVGVGGASIISRAFGADNQEKAFLTFGNQTLLIGFVAILTIVIGLFFITPLLELFGGKGDLYPPSKTYLSLILPGIPFLAWTMMSNNVFRAEGMPKVAMTTMLVPAVVNLTLDPIFIIVLDWGIEGAAYATCLSYIASALFTMLYFVFGKSQLSFNPKYLVPNWSIIKEISSIGVVTFSRQVSLSLLAIVLNNSLFAFGAELAVSAYGIVSRLTLLAFFPVFGVTQGFLPIASFNFGAKKMHRVKEVIIAAIRYGSAISLLVFIAVMLFAKPIVSLFTKDPALIAQTTPALRWIFLATPLITIQLIASAYYQAIGKAIPAFILSLIKQIVFLIPLVIILSRSYGVNGIWHSFPISDVLATIVCFVFIYQVFKQLRMQANTI